VLLLSRYLLLTTYTSSSRGSQNQRWQRKGRRYAGVRRQLAATTRAGPRVSATRARTTGTRTGFVERERIEVEEVVGADGDRITCRPASRCSVPAVVVATSPQAATSEITTGSSRAALAELEGAPSVHCARAHRERVVPRDTEILVSMFTLW
jgi:hypothetical protein